MRVEELEVRIKHLIKSLANFKDWAKTLETCITSNNEEIPKPLNYTQSHNEKERKLLDSLRDVNT